MKIYVEDRIIIIKFKTKEEEISVKDHFTFDDASYAFMGGSFSKNRIRKMCFLKRKKEYYFLNSGFYLDLLRFAKEKDILINEFKDERTKFEHHREFKDYELSKYFPENFNYIDHQVRSLKQMLKTNVGIIEAPTSSGKSLTIAAFLRITKLPSLVLVNRVNLAMQLQETFTNSGIENVGICHGKNFKNGNVVVSTIGSVKKIPDLHKFKILIADETHHLSSKTYQEFLSKTFYPLRFGFSATPNAGDKYKWALIRQYMGDIIYKVEVKKLIDKEVIAKPHIRFVPIECPPTLDWPSANEYCIIKNNKRNNKIKEMVKEHDVPTLILIRMIEHGELLNELIPGSVFVSGVDDADGRKNIINNFENKNIDVIIATSIFNEGISINAIKLLIIASGGKSNVEVVQRLGRSLRLTENKKEVEVIDFFDLNNRFTEKHSNIRRKIYEKTGFEIID